MRVGTFENGSTLWNLGSFRAHTNIPVMHPAARYRFPPLTINKLVKYPVTKGSQLTKRNSAGDFSREPRPRVIVLSCPYSSEKTIIQYLRHEKLPKPLLTLKHSTLVGE